MVPAGTPKEIIARLNAEIVKALADPEVREKLRDQGLTPRGTIPKSSRRPARSSSHATRGSSRKPTSRRSEFAAQLQKKTGSESRPHKAHANI